MFEVIGGELPLPVEPLPVEPLPLEPLGEVVADVEESVEVPFDDLSPSKHPATIRVAAIAAMVVIRVVIGSAASRTNLSCVS